MVERLIKSGWELDSHTISHLDLTTLDGSRLRREVAGSRQILQGRFHQPVNFFCYPAGKFDARTVRSVRDAGYRARRPSCPGKASKDAMFELHRIRIDGSDGVSGLATKLGQAGGLATASSSSSCTSWTWRNMPVRRRRSGTPLPVEPFLCFLHFFFFLPPPGAGVTVGPPPPPAGPHGISVIGAEFGLGPGVASLKSVALLFVSSALSRAVGQFAAIERMMALPSPIPPAVPLPWNGEPAESGEHGVAGEGAPGNAVLEGRLGDRPADRAGCGVQVEAAVSEVRCDPGERGREAAVGNHRRRVVRAVRNGGRRVRGA
jgi:hypothetical protein